ncbi:MAG: hypothetical protein RLZZ324_6 [Candidatus Parcubacteria bacterium]|jgi:hypothetical protein
MKNVSTRSFHVTTSNAAVAEKDGHHRLISDILASLHASGGGCQNCTSCSS